MGKKQIKFIFIICCLLALIFSDTTEDESYDVYNNEFSFNGSGSKVFKLNFATLDMDYIHVIAESQSKSNPILIIAD